MPEGVQSPENSNPQIIHLKYLAQELEYEKAAQLAISIAIENASLNEVELRTVVEYGVNAAIQGGFTKLADRLLALDSVAKLDSDVLALRRAELQLAKDYKAAIPELQALTRSSIIDVQLSAKITLIQLSATTATDAIQRQQVRREAEALLVDAQHYKSKSNQAIIREIIAKLLLEDGDLEAAKEHLFQSVSIYRELGRYDGANRVRLLFVDKLRRSHQLSEAEAMALQAVADAEDKKFTLLEAIARSSLALVYAEERDGESAAREYDRAISIHEAASRNQLAVRMRVNKAHMLANYDDKLVEAELEFETALKYFESTNDLTGQGSCLLGLSHVLIQERKYQQAIKPAEMAYEVAGKTGGQPSILATCHQTLWIVNAKLGNEVSAQLHREKFRQESLRAGLPAGAVQLMEDEIVKQMKFN